MYGAIVIEGDKDDLPEYEKDKTLLLNDWFHDSDISDLAGLLATPFRMSRDAQSLLVNGRGEFNCSEIKCMTGKQDFIKPCNASSPDAGPFYLDVQPDTTYRLRLVGSAKVNLINFGIEMHEMTVVEAETTLLKPFKAHFLDVAPGQSYSVLMRTKSASELAAIPNNNGKFALTSTVQLPTFPLCTLLTLPHSCTQVFSGCSSTSVTARPGQLAERFCVTLRTKEENTQLAGSHPLRPVMTWRGRYARCASSERSSRRLCRCQHAQFHSSAR